MPGLLGTTENELGLRPWLESLGHTLVSTSDKDGENSTFDRELVDAEIIVTTPYSPLSLSLLLPSPSPSPSPAPTPTHPSQFLSPLLTC